MTPNQTLEPVPKPASTATCVYRTLKSSWLQLLVLPSDGSPESPPNVRGRAAPRVSRVASQRGRLYTEARDWSLKTTHSRAPGSDPRVWGLVRAGSPAAPAHQALPGKSQARLPWRRSRTHPLPGSARAFPTRAPLPGAWPRAGSEAGTSGGGRWSGSVFMAR